MGGHTESDAAVALAGAPAGNADISMSASAAGTDYCWRGSVQLGLGYIFSAVASPVVAATAAVEISSAYQAH